MARVVMASDESFRNGRRGHMPVPQCLHAHAYALCETTRPICSYGQCSYGQCDYGQCSYDLCSYGPGTEAGTDRAVPDSMVGGMPGTIGAFVLVASPWSTFYLSTIRYFSSPMRRQDGRISDFVLVASPRRHLQISLVPDFSS